MRVRELLTRTAQELAACGVAEARLDAEVLLAHVLGVERTALYADLSRPLASRECRHFRSLARARARLRIPLAYLTGRREFWSRSFHVTPRVLIPRPETETLVEVALERLGNARVPHVLEIGVGAGVVSASMALEHPRARFVGVDLSRAALAVARGNFERLGVSERVMLLCGDSADALDGRFDLMLSNPPYVAQDELEKLEAELRHEPRQALDGGRDGLDCLRVLIAQAPRLVRPGGHLVLEIGQGQAAAVAHLLERAGAESWKSHADLAGVERVICARFPQV